MSIDLTNDDRMIKHMHARLDAMANTLKDKFKDRRCDYRAEDDGTRDAAKWENAGEKGPASVGRREIGKCFINDREGVLRSASRTAQHTPSREVYHQKEKVVSKKEHSDLNFFKAGADSRIPAAQARPPLMARDDLAHLKDRLRKALQTAPDSMNMKAAVAVKSDDIIKFKSSVAKTYDLLQSTEGSQTSGRPYGSKAVFATLDEKSIGKETSAHRWQNRSIGVPEYQLESSISEHDRDKSAGSRAESICKLEKRILRLRTENSQLGVDDSNMSLKSTGKKHQEKENFRQPTGSNSRSMYRASRVAVGPVPAVRIPQYLYPSRPSGRDHPSSRQDYSSSLTFNRSCSMTASVKPSRRRDVLFDSIDPGMTTAGKSKLDSLYLNFVKSKDYWNDIWQKRLGSSSKTKYRP